MYVECWVLGLMPVQWVIEPYVNQMMPFTKFNLAARGEFGSKKRALSSVPTAEVDRYLYSLPPSLLPFVCSLLYTVPYPKHWTQDYQTSRAL